MGIENTTNFQQRCKSRRLKYEIVLNKCSKCIAQFFLQYMRLKQSGVHCQCVQRCNLIVTAVTQVPLTPACRITTVQWKHFNSCCTPRERLHFVCRDGAGCRICSTISGQVSSLLSLVHQLVSSISMLVYLLQMEVGEI